MATTQTLALLQELEHEANNTRKLLQVITNDILNYKPDYKSWTTADLAAHIAESYHWYVPTVRADGLDFGKYQYDKGDITDIGSIIKRFEDNLQEASACLKEISSDDALVQPWSIIMNGQVLNTMPRGIVIRSMLMNHLYHHRGQLTVYLRACGKKVPGIYGPSQDER